MHWTAQLLPCCPGAGTDYCECPDGHPCTDCDHGYVGRTSYVRASRECQRGIHHSTTTPHICLR